MARRLSTPWPTAPRSLFFDDTSSGPTRAQATKDQRIRRIATGVWTADLSSPVETIIAANILQIVSHRVGPSVLVDRTAAASGRIDHNLITISTNHRSSDWKLPGVTIRVRPLDQHHTDLPFSDNLTLAAPARTLVDNLAGPPNADRYLTRAELQDWLTRKKLEYDDTRFERLLAEAHTLAVDLNLDIANQIDRLFDIVTHAPGAPRPSGTLTIASAAGDLYDQRRLDLFAAAAEQLNAHQLSPPLPEPQQDGGLPFYEAYFSNFIEGTRFSVDEARHIIETNEAPADRPEDGHDILGTYHSIIDRAGRAATASSPTELADLLKRRHATFMAGRPNLRPGTYKDKNNFVNTTAFVDHGQVEGTMSRALQRAASVPPGFQRAVYLMIVIAEIHPFLDGNGRAARLMMNAELSAQGLCRIVIPTVIRNEYILGLRRFSNTGNIDAVFRILDHCWRWTLSVPWTSGEATDGYLATTNAFVDSTEAAERGIALTIL